MSVEAMAAVLHHSRAKGTAKLVLLGIANHAGDGGAWPSIATLARYANVHERNVQRALDELVALGELARYLNDGGDVRRPSYQRPNRYDVLVACPIECDRTANHKLRQLPKAPADLWIEGVAPAPGGGASATGGVAPAPAGGVAPASPEPSYQPSLNSGSEVSNQQTARASRRPCSVCGLDESECQRRAHISDHTYQPTNRRKSA